jgi:hypothetical protein
MAHGLGLDVRVLNPGSGKTFHPKLYLAEAGEGASAVIGSANLTGGLATNLEAAVALRGARSDQPIASAWNWAETLWQDPRVVPWQLVAAEAREEPFEPDLYRALRAEVRKNPVFLTLSQGRPNRVVEIDPVEVHVVTGRSKGRNGGAEPIPAWMFNLAWDRLRSFGSLSNKELCDDMRVHRSAGGLAILARIPGVEAAPGRKAEIRWR